MRAPFLVAGALVALLAAPLAEAALASKADEARVLAFLRDWQQAWESQDLEDYLGFYAEDAQVGSRNREQLAEQKRRLFARGEAIGIRLGDARVSSEGALIRADFLQDYSSPSLSDFGRKELLLRPSDGSFLIVRESWEPAPGAIERALSAQLDAALAAAAPPAAAPPAEREQALPPEPVFTPLDRPAAAPPRAVRERGAVEPLLGEGYAPPLGASPDGSSERVDDLLALEPLAGEMPSYLQPVSFPGLPGDIDERTLVEEVVARVNGRVLTRSDFVERLEGRHLQLMLGQAPDLRARLAELVPETLLLTVERWLLVQEADVDRAGVEQFWRGKLAEIRKEAGVGSIDELEKLLESEGMSLVTLREQVIAQEVVYQKVTSRIDRSEERLRAEYEANGSRYAQPARVALRQILVPVAQPSDLPRAEQAVEEALAQLSTGAEWCDVQAVYGVGGSPCGDIGRLAIDDLLPELREVAAGLPIDAVSKPIRTSAGLHLIQVRERSEVQVPPFEELRTRIEAEVVDRDFERRLEDYLADLKSTAVIEINPRYQDLWESPGVGQ